MFKNKTKVVVWVTFESLNDLESSLIDQTVLLKWDIGNHGSGYIRPFKVTKESTLINEDINFFYTPNSKTNLLIYLNEKDPIKIELKNFISSTDIIEKAEDVMFKESKVKLTFKVLSIPQSELFKYSKVQKSNEILKNDVDE